MQCGIHNAFLKRKGTKCGKDRRKFAAVRRKKSIRHPVGEPAPRGFERKVVAHPLDAHGVVQGYVGRLAFHEHQRLSLVKNYGVKSFGLPVHVESALNRNYFRRVVGLEDGAPQKVLAHILFGGGHHPLAAQRVPKPTLGIRNEVGIRPRFVLHVAKVM